MGTPLTQGCCWLCRLTREKGFTFKQDGEHGFRRVVASPQPLKILEAAAIKVCCTAACHVQALAPLAVSCRLTALCRIRQGTSKVKAGRNPSANPAQSPAA